MISATDIASKRIKEASSRRGNDASLGKAPPGWTIKIGILNYLQEVADAMAYASFNCACAFIESLTAKEARHLIVQQSKEVSNHYIEEMDFWATRLQFQKIEFTMVCERYPRITEEEILSFDNDKADYEKNAQRRNS